MWRAIRPSEPVASTRRRGGLRAVVGWAELGQCPRRVWRERRRQVLERYGNERELNGVLPVAVGDRRQAKRVWQPPAVGLAVPGEREHRLQQALEPQRGSYLAPKSGPAFACVPERVRGTRFHDHGLAGRCEQSLATEPEPHRAIQDLEGLCLFGMNVHARQPSLPGTSVTSAITSSPSESADVR